ncbi:MAG: hypothetical protein ABI907_05480 [Ramlibacter sp.]
MLVSQKLAIAAHLHVLLRRKTGRVTDTEWMAENIEYAMEIVRFTRAKAVEDGHPDLLEWADKLERAVLETVPAKRPLAQTAMQLLRERPAAPAAAAPTTPTPAAAAPESTGFGHSVFGDTGFIDSTFGTDPRKVRDPNAPRYVGGIR